MGKKGRALPANAAHHRGIALRESRPPGLLLQTHDYPTVNGQLSTVNCQLSTLTFLRSVACQPALRLARTGGTHVL